MIVSISMTHVSPAPTPEIPLQAFHAPNEIVPLLIGSTVGLTGRLGFGREAPHRRAKELTCPR